MVLKLFFGCLHNISSPDPKGADQPGKFTMLVLFISNYHFHQPEKKEDDLNPADD